jgi:hypothetical protein
MAGTNTNPKPSLEMAYPVLPGAATMELTRWTAEFQWAHRQWSTNVKLRIEALERRVEALEV